MIQYEVGTKIAPIMVGWGVTCEMLRARMVKFLKQKLISGQKSISQFLFPGQISEQRNPFDNDSKFLFLKQKSV